jgi:phage shock protein PspC (stress-responsive transcriptional regulator)
MSTSDELNKLADLHARGVLSDEEFARAKARALGDEPGAATAPGMSAQSVNSLRRSRNDRWLGGVCGGIARATGLDSWIWRLAFTLGVMFAGGGIFIYLLLWIFVPED